MKILVIVAGTSEPSNCALLAEAFARGMRRVPDTDVQVMRLKDMNIRHFTLEFYQPECRRDDDFCTLQDAFLAADGVVIASPIWNFSVPAHLKNAIDRLGAVALDVETRTKGLMRGKPAYFLFTGGAPKAAWKGLMRFTTSHVQEALRYYHCTIVGTFFEGKCMAGSGVFGLVIDKRPDALAKAERCGERFASFTARLLRTGTLPLYYRLLMRGYKTGQRILAKF
ncbi:MAG: hypothetical protein G01um101425_868 [Candidatus Peregrinibacteria bacterium Gr01-1014_25]|nr:MAG: hypothetical protein G01um101425_868 [Candidatus Peregrinibacteria bacterium Gr01-1014_25]